MLQKFFYLAITSILICSGTAHSTRLTLAQPTAQELSSLRNRFRKAKSFVAPNEPNPADALPVWKKSIGGVYISVGTERGFIGAAFSGATQLLLLDLDPSVVRFNRLIILLLKACAGDSDAYMRARKDASASEVIVNQAKTLTSSERATLLAGIGSEQWQVWQTMFRSTHFLSISQNEYSKDYNGSFHDAHYALDQAAFQKITNMALEGDIQAEFLDLSSPSQVDQLISAMATANVNISVLDLANAWEAGYIGPRQTQTLIKRLQPLTRPESIVLLTSLSYLDGMEWFYHANTFAELAHNGYLHANIPASDDGEYYVSEFFQTIHGPFKALSCNNSLKSSD